MTLQNQYKLVCCKDFKGLCALFIQHTSASLLVQENYEASASDLEFGLIGWCGNLSNIATTEGPDNACTH